MQLRCPHCHNPIQVVEEKLDDLVCPGCGSSFRVQGAERDISTTATNLRRVGKFELMERVGVGGFGSVYRAHDTELDRLVAIKIAHPSLLESEHDRNRVLREARAAAQLRHPGIVTVHEVRELDGDIPTIVSDFVEGITLRDLLEIRKLTFRESAALVAEVADALDHTHTLGLVHRDIKLSNIMIDYPRGVSFSGSFDPKSDVGRDERSAGPPNPGPQSAAAPMRRSSQGELVPPDTPQRPRPILLDFGLALRDEAEVTMTVDGQIIGMPAYMPPEQAAGKSHHVDRRSDVYSLGVVLYELLCGEIPFRGSKVMRIHQVLREEPRSPRGVNDKIPRDLETICLKAMSKVPARRYATARELAHDLRRWLAGEPITARPVTQPERLVGWCQRNPVPARLTATIALLLIIGTAVSWCFALQARAEARFVKRHLCAAHMNLSQSAWEAAQVGETIRLQDLYWLAKAEDEASSLAAARSRVASVDLRGFEWFYWDHMVHSCLLNLKGHTRDVQSGLHCSR